MTQAANMRLLIAYDGSPAARAAVAAAGAMFPGATATVLAVRRPELDDVRPADARTASSAEDVRAALAAIERTASARAAAVVDDGVRLAAEAGLHATGALATAARPRRALEAAATRVAADLIVAGTHGHGPIGRAFLGSTAAGLLQRAPVPVLVIPPGVARPRGPVIIGYDGSDCAAQAVRFAAGCLPQQPALVATVWRSPMRHAADRCLLDTLPAERRRALVAAFDEACAAEARQTAERGAALAADAGMPAEARPIESDATPWRPLLELASAEHAAMIVTGSTGPGGAVTTGLLHHAAVAILVVPSPTERREPRDREAAPALQQR